MCVWGGGGDTYIKGFSKRPPREPTISPSVQNAWPRKSCKHTNEVHACSEVEELFNTRASNSTKQNTTATAARTPQSELLVLSCDQKKKEIKIILKQNLRLNIKSYNNETYISVKSASFHSEPFDLQQRNSGLLSWIFSVSGGSGVVWKLIKILVHTKQVTSGSLENAVLVKWTLGQVCCGVKAKSTDDLKDARRSALWVDRGH